MMRHYDEASSAVRAVSDARIVKALRRTRGPVAALANRNRF
jgi:hypothetical protein